ncbi:Unknown protein [Striga hermonthica]|uniref:Uncharacterized protein n=1 Tax=Striga hermonthica TaxID=68872 RepID=A0A9N7R5M7_STRHE|nr:Unknown protein [Striga hermonthica]
MDGPPYSSSSSDTSSPFSSSSSSPAKPATSPAVLSIECLKGSSRGGEWSGDMLQTGDVVEELRIGNMVMKSPFRNGKSAVQKILHGAYKNKETSIRVRVRRGSDEFAELQACIVPGDQFLGRKQYVLRAIDDPNYAVGFVDRTEAECFKLQASRSIRMVSALERAPLQDGYVSYPWERKMHEMLAIPSSSSFYSVLFLPKSSDKAGTRYNDLEDTLARAHAWINASQESGAPVVFMSVQTESLLTKISGETASSTVNAGSLADLSNIANTSLYGFEDYHGVDIGVVRAVRLWFSPLAGEIPIQISIKDSDTKLGFAISRTAEGFIHISSVTRGAVDGPSARSGLSHLHEQATRSSRLLIVSRIANQKVLPWMVSTTGAIRCFDTVSLSQKLSLHRHTRVPVILHVFLWDRNVSLAADADRGLGARPTSRDDVGLETDTNGSLESREMEGDSSIESRDSDSGMELRLDRDTAGEFSFRFLEDRVPHGGSRSAGLYGHQGGYKRSLDQLGAVWDVSYALEAPWDKQTRCRTTRKGPNARSALWMCREHSGSVGDIPGVWRAFRKGGECPGGVQMCLEACRTLQSLGEYILEPCGTIRKLVEIFRSLDNVPKHCGMFRKLQERPGIMENSGTMWKDLEACGTFGSNVESFRTFSSIIENSSRGMNILEPCSRNIANLGAGAHHHDQRKEVPGSKSSSRRGFGTGSSCWGKEEKLERVEFNFQTLETHVLEEMDSMKPTIQEGLKRRPLAEDRLDHLEDFVKGQLVDLVTGLQASIEGMREDLAVCKRVIASREASHLMSSPKVECPKPTGYNGVMDAKEVDNFLWSMQQYFEGIRLKDESTKVCIDVLYLSDTAILWWRRKHADIGRGVCRIESWDDFTRELKRKF